MSIRQDSGAARAGERRFSARRRNVDEHGIVSARVRPGHEVAVIDVSAGGALVESMRRLLPGTPVELQLFTGQARAVVRGRVLRCVVAHVRAAAIFYRGAIGFDRHLTWFLDDDRVGAAGPADVDVRQGRAPWAHATHHAF